MVRSTEGRKYVLFVAKYDSEEQGEAIMYQSEHTISRSYGTDSHQTKMGVVTSPTATEKSVSSTFVAYENEDGSTTQYDKLKEWADARDLVIIWEVNLNRVVDGKYKITQFTGRVNNIEEPRPAEGLVEVSVDYTIEDETNGEETLSSEFVSVIDEAAREYRNLQQDQE